MAFSQHEENPPSISSIISRFPCYQHIEFSFVLCESNGRLFIFRSSMLRFCGCTVTYFKHNQMNGITQVYTILERVRTILEMERLLNKIRNSHEKKKQTYRYMNYFEKINYSYLQYRYFRDYCNLNIRLSKILYGISGFKYIVSINTPFFEARFFMFAL